jgi:hypothetical protein
MTGDKWVKYLLLIWLIVIFYIHIICFGLIVINLFTPPYAIHFWHEKSDIQPILKSYNADILKQYHKCRLNHRDISYEEYREIEQL